MNLVIVESPAKAKTINKFLGKIIPSSLLWGISSTCPKANWELTPKTVLKVKYITIRGKGSLGGIAQTGRQSEAVYLATDPDRRVRQ